MGNLINSIKKFLANKNTVTLLCLLAGIVVLFFFYTWRVNNAISPIKVPVAKNIIDAAQEITSENIDYVEVSSAFLSKSDVYTQAELGQLIGKYVATGTSIPAGGVFYKAQVVDKSSISNAIFDDIEDGYTPFTLSVDNHSTFGNSIYPGDKIDLFLKATDDDGKIIFGKFIESITVLAVFDSSGKNVFALGQTGTPAELVFSVEDEMYILLKYTEYMNVEVVPVPRNKNYTAIGGEVKTYEYLRDFILSKASPI